ncbi:hypothetical protein [Nesterenkonia alba]|uniref:hypothetical protein n=1 Tax=Nesterenkonia alba TaxID=515814 RepID=UPI0003B7048B|nr:hypothetical protein [Nesterenkonia alba]
MPEEPQDRRRSLLESVKAPLLFSFALAFVAGFVTLFASSGGSDNPRVEHTVGAEGGLNSPINLSLIAFGVVFIVALLVVSMLQLASRENPEHLSEGAGVNRNSEELYRRQVAERRERQRREEQKKARARGEEPPYGRDADPDN